MMQRFNIGLIKSTRLFVPCNTKFYDIHGKLSGKEHVSTRFFSTKNVKELKADNLTIVKKIGKPSPLPKLEDLVFGQSFGDHMLEIDWDSENGWHDPIIKQFGSLLIHPASSALHYSIQCFEGLKAYKNKDGKILLFRPEENMHRFNKSCMRLGLPSFNEEELLKLIKELLKLDHQFIPDKDGYSIYIRPTAISTQPTLGVAPPTQAKIYVMTSPVGPYYPTGFKPVSLYADTKNVRSWPGGSGGCKLGANYGPTISPQILASKKGYSQVLWLLPKNNDYLLTEVGTMNLFIRVRLDDGTEEIITPPLDDGVILPGVTRDSIIELLKEDIQNKKKISPELDFSKIKFYEKNILMNKDFIPNYKQGRIIEVFGSGTAAVISPVTKIGFKDEIINIDFEPNNPKKGGQLANYLLKRLYDIQYGRSSHKFSHLVQ